MFIKPSERSNLATLRSLVQTATARYDSNMQTFIDRAINWAMLTAAVLFKPTELYEIGYVVVPSGNWQANLANGIAYGSDGIVSIESMSWGTGNQILPLPLSYMWTLTGPRSAGYPKYWSWRSGYILIFDKFPANDLTVEVRYVKTPEYLTSNSSNVAFGGYDGLIVSLATKLTFAAMEEVESSNVWSDLVKEFTEVGSVDAQSQALLKGQLKQLFPMTGSKEGK